MNTALRFRAARQLDRLLFAIEWRVDDQIRRLVPELGQASNAIDDGDFEKAERLEKFLRANLGELQRVVDIATMLRLKRFVRNTKAAKVAGAAP